MPAEKTFPAEGFHVYRDSVTGLHICYGAADIFNDTDHFMSDGYTRHSTGDASMFNVQVT